MVKGLPNWLELIFAKALLGEIYPAIRAIALEYSREERELLVQVYFDREPDEDDVENIEVILTNICAMATEAEIHTAKIECVKSNEPIGRLNPLDGFVFARSEIRPSVPYLQGPYTWSD